MRYEQAVLLSFEGPDPYAMVGGLGTRVASLSEALGAAGIRTTLLFVGDPAKPPVEQAAPNIEYRRWCQWISAERPSGVYDGEHEKTADSTASAPRFLVEEIVLPAARRGERTLVIAEEWQTAAAAIEIDRLAREHGVRDRLALLWNANNTYGFERIDWPALRRAVRLTAVSKFMKFELRATDQESGDEALVIPNGIADRLLAGAEPRLTAGIERALPQRPLFVKIGRFDADKRWMQAIDAFALIRARRPDARLVIRGGKEAYGAEVLARAAAHGLEVEPVTAAREPRALIEALGASRSPIVEIRSFVPEEMLLALYRAADAVIANSGKEPFGLVGLEVMSAGGVAVCGATGEEYAQPFENAIVCDTGDPRELAANLDMLLEDPKLAKAIRAAGRKTAERFTWSRVLDLLDRKLAYATSGS